MVSNREDAYKTGELFFFTGKQCKHGHISKRYTSTGACAACLSEHNRGTSATNKSRRRFLNGSRIKDARLYTTTLPIEWHAVIDAIGDIIYNGTDTARADLHTYVLTSSAANLPPSVLGALNTTQLREIMHLAPDGRTVTNLADFDTADCETHNAIYMRGNWYEQLTLADALYGRTTSVAPIYIEPHHIPPTMKGIIK